MKRIAAIALVLLMVLTMAVTVSALPEKRIPITVYTNAPKLDGIVNEGEWDAENAIVMSADNCAPWQGEIDNAIQVKLLRVLEERVFERVGGSETISADIRLIAATHRDLHQRVKEGKFREDLLYRLDVINIHLPTLAERSSDIPALCNHFLREFSEKNGKPISGITAEAVNLLSAYSWPGNVRELRNTIEKMVVLAHGDRLTVRDVPANIREAVRGTAPGLSAGGGGSLADVERQKILSVLEKQGGNRTRAALELGISRRTLHRKLQEYRAMGLLPGE